MAGRGAAPAPGVLWPGSAPPGALRNVPGPARRRQAGAAAPARPPGPSLTVWEPERYHTRCANLKLRRNHAHYCASYRDRGPARVAAGRAGVRQRRDGGGRRQRRTPGTAATAVLGWLRRGGRRRPLYRPSALESLQPRHQPSERPRPVRRAVGLLQRLRRSDDPVVGRELGIQQRLYRAHHQHAAGSHLERRRAVRRQGRSLHPADPVGDRPGGALGHRRAGRGAVRATGQR